MNSVGIVCFVPIILNTTNVGDFKPQAWYNIIMTASWIRRAKNLAACSFTLPHHVLDRYIGTGNVEVQEAREYKIETKSFRYPDMDRYTIRLM